MQQELTSRRRRWPLILIALVPVLAGLWSAAWYYAADRAEAMIAGWRERQATAGRVHTCGSQTVGGFPFRFELRCTDSSLEIQRHDAPPLLIKAKDVLITARVWQPTLLISEIAGPLTITGTGEGTTVTIKWQQAQTELRGSPTSPEQFAITLDQPVIERADGAQTQQLFNAQRFELRGRMIEGSAASNPVIEVVLKLAKASAPTLHPLTVQPLDADITSVLRGLKDFAAKSWPDRFREIQAAGGRLEITNARVQQGDTIATANGPLGLSPSGRPDGQLRLTVANLINLMPALGLDGRSPQGTPGPLGGAASRLDQLAPGLGGVARQNAGPALVAGLNFIGKPAEIEGKRAITLPLRFNDGAVSLGPIPLGRAAALF